MGVGVWLALFLFFCGLFFPFFFLYFSRAVRSLGLFPCVTEDMNYMGWFWGGDLGELGGLENWENWENGKMVTMGKGFDAQCHGSLALALVVMRLS
jgi:hypothetical protein